MVVFAPDEVGLADKSPCAGIRADLKMCLLASDCCKKVSFCQKYLSEPFRLWSVTYFLIVITIQDYSCYIDFAFIHEFK